MTSPLPRRRGVPARRRAGLVGAAVLLLLATVFSAWPALDLWASRAFVVDGKHFIGDDFAAIRGLYRAMPVIGWLCFFAGAIVHGLWRRHPGPLGMRWSRRLAALALVSLVGSGLLINLGVKERWGRARPVQVAEFGGQKHFTPALQPADQCAHNCSFVSGHAASGFVLMAVGLMGPVAVRRRWLAIGLAAGAVAGLARIMEGGHFLSDTLFSGWLIWATGWVLREVWLARKAAARRRRLAGGPPGDGQQAAARAGIPGSGP